MSETRGYVLRNSELAVIVVPGEGGRVASLRSLHSGVEFLTQSRHSGISVRPALSTSFQNGPCAGIEECLPTVGACGPGTQGGAVPDHGDFWRLDWKITQSASTQLRLHAIGFSRPLLFCKELSLEGRELRISYRVENLQSAPTSFLYACHPLFAVREGDQILLPREAQSLTLYYSRSERLGTAGARIGWPRMQSGLRLDVVDAATAGTAEMLYSGWLNKGYCGLYRGSVHQGLTLSFDVEKLPYVGLWLCYGGWPDDAVQPRQYAVAIEPTTAPFNTLEEAQHGGSAIALGSGESFDWEIRFQATAPGISLAEFRSLSEASNRDVL